MSLPEVYRLAGYNEEFLRPHVPAMDNLMMGGQIPVLDHGFIRVVDYMGNDAAICQAARTSYGKGTKSVSEDRGLIRYLMRHWHSTPFEMCELKLHVKLPMFVARQWVRHRTANINEYSARYSILDREFYIPEPDVIAEQSTTNNQGRGTALNASKAAMIAEWLRDEADSAYDAYEAMIGDQNNVARELARMNLPVNIYTQWYWKVDLHNLFHFLRLRADPHAQYEIRVYADAICKIVADWVPQAYEAFVDYRLQAQSMSRMDMTILAELAAKPENKFFIESLDADACGLSAREMKEFKQKLGVAT